MGTSLYSITALVLLGIGVTALLIVYRYRDMQKEVKQKRVDYEAYQGILNKYRVQKARADHLDDLRRRKDRLIEKLRFKVRYFKKLKRG